MQRFGLLWLIPVALALEITAVEAFGLEPIQQGIVVLADLFGLHYNSFLIWLGTSLLGLTSGVVGAFAVLKKRSLVGDAVAHAALPGLAIAFMLIGERNFIGMLTGAAISGILGSLAISWLIRHTRIKSDAAIGIVLSVLFGLGIALSRIIQDDPTGQQAGLDAFLLGKTAGMISQDLLTIALVAANVLVMVALLYKEFKLIGFDPDFAAVLGWPVLVLDGLLMALLVFTTVIGLPAVGVVLIAAMLIIPGVSARFWTDKLHVLVPLAGFFGLLTGFVGTYASAQFADLPAGAVIVLSGSAVFMISMLVAPRRGLIARSLLELTTRLRIARQNLLRTLFEAAEENENIDIPITPSVLLKLRSWSPRQLQVLSWWGRLLGEVESHPTGWRLTEAGRRHAAQIVRAHRLWEVYLVEQASIASDHVHRDADEIEHVLTPEILKDLEQKLQAAGRWPATAPSSVHPLTEGEHA